MSELTNVCKGMTNWQRCRFHRDLREQKVERNSAKAVELAKVWANTPRQEHEPNGEPS